MAWESRDGRGRYYTRTVRVGGRRIRQYFGTGLAAKQAAMHDAERRDERRARLQQQRAEETRYQSAIEPLLAICWLTDQLLAAILADHGYHRHDRGAWRRRRHGKNE
jgi:hypothetical protein